MNFDELQKQWQSQPGGLKIRIDADVLLKEVQRNKESFESSVFWSDVREIGISLALVPIFIYFALTMHVWTLYLPALACVFLPAFMIIDRTIQKKKLPNLSDSLTGCIEISLAQVEHQTWLLKNVFWWYLLPFIIGVSIFWVHVGWLARDAGGTGLLFIGGCFALLFVVSVGVYYLNQWAVRKELLPRKQELEQLLRSLQNDNG
jgi:hypothetical protein